MENKKWSNEEIEFLKSKYNEYGPKKCAEHLSRTKRAVFEKAKTLKLKMDEKTKKSLLTKHDEQKMRDAINQSFCYADVMRNLGIQPKAGNYETVKRYIRKYSIDISHFKSPTELIKTRWENGYQVKEKNLDEYLIKDVRYNNNKRVKQLLFRDGRKKRECEMCGTGEEWNGKKLSLILDHIDGNNTNYLIENLRIICPNCDSTLDTFCYRNVKNREETKKKCNCGKNIDKKAKRCVECYNKERESNIIPNLSHLKSDVEELGYCGTGRKYGVSDNTIRKWIKKIQ